MEILIYLTDGGVTRLNQPDPTLAEEILRRIQPNHLFGQSHLTVLAGGALHSFPTTAVTRVDFLTPSLPDWPFPGNVVDVRSISAAEFAQKFPPRGLPPVQGPFTVFNEFVLVHSAPQFVELLIQPPPSEGMPNPLDMSLFLQHLLSAPVFLFRVPGGLALLNPAHLLRFSLYPAPPSSMAGSWIAELL